MNNEQVGKHIVQCFTGATYHTFFNVSYLGARKGKPFQNFIELNECQRKHQSIKL